MSVPGGCEQLLDHRPGADHLASIGILAPSAERRPAEGVMVFAMDLAGDLPQTLLPDERNRWIWLLDTDMDAGTGDPYYDLMLGARDLSGILFYAASRNERSCSASGQLSLSLL